MSRATAETYDRINGHWEWRSAKKFVASMIGSSMRVFGDTSVEFIKQSSILNRKEGVKGRSEFFPENE